MSTRLAIALILALIAAGIGWMGYGGFMFGIPALIIALLDLKRERTVALVVLIFACIGIIESIAVVTLAAALGLI
jgi:hypothetical protein